MASGNGNSKYRSIYSPSTPKERADNFESYWEFTLARDGDILEAEKTLTKKKAILAKFQREPVRSRSPLPDPEAFYHNYVHMKVDPKSLDTKTRLLTCLYKFARHEWVGISAAWEAIPTMAQAKTTTDKISRYHLCEEFCHVRLFHEMFRTFHLEEVEWVPLGKGQEWLYKIFPKLPEQIMSTPAFLSEMMGISFYTHLNRLLDKVLDDEPEARDRLKALLREIMVDELAHIGQRRNYIGSFGMRWCKKMLPLMMKMFWNTIPEGKHLFDIQQMTEDGLNFDYNEMPTELIRESWVPS